jgi:hypothetical protein
MATERDIGILRPEVESLSTDMAELRQSMALVQESQRQQKDTQGKILEAVESIQDQMEHFTRYMERTIWDIGKQLGPDALLILTFLAAVYAAGNPEAAKSVWPISNVEDALSSE